MFSVYTTDRNLTYRIDAEGAYEAIEICRPAAESDGVRITGAAPYDALLGIDLAEGEVTQAQLDKAMADHADSIDDAKVTRADGTIDGAKLIDEMFGR